MVGIRSREHTAALEIESWHLELCNSSVSTGDRSHTGPLKLCISQISNHTAPCVHSSSSLIVTVGSAKICLLISSHAVGVPFTNMHFPHQGMVV